jgi:arginine/ornithine transport system permease protein
MFTTIELLVISVILGLIISVLLANLKNSKIPMLKKIIGIFTYYFRGTPLLIQIFLIYYGIGQFVWIRDSFLWYFFQKPYFCAILALTLNNTAYTTEIIYNAIITTDNGEIEAAKAFGMTKYQSILYIIMPSALRRSIPAYSNEIIFMLHATSLVSVITILDITGVAKMVYSRYFIPFEAFIMAAIFYVFLSLIIIKLFRFLEKKYMRYLKN